LAYSFLPEYAVEALPQLSGSAAKVLVAVASFMPGRGQEGCYPSLAAIGERSGIKREKSLTAAIKELATAGVLVCEHRKRQTNRLKWTRFDPAESACPRIQGPAVSAPLEPLGPAESAPLNSIQGPAVSAQVYPAVSAPRKVPKEGTQLTTTTSLATNSDILERKGSDEPAFLPQRPKTPPPLPPAPAAGPAKKPRRKANEHPTWLLWLKVNQDAGRPKPLEEKSSLTAAKTMAEQIPDPEEQEAIMWAYIQDKADIWVIDRGLTLSDLVKFRLSKCRTAAARAIKEQAEDDAELIRGAEQKFTDPNELADYFWIRKQLGQRVPPGVICKPMPIEAEKEATA
jgi:hypothetical protein